MPRRTARLARPAIALLALSIAGVLHAQQVPAPRDLPYAPGAITLEVDATNLPQRVMRIRETIPVTPGPLTLLYPQWLPGNHAPRGPIDKIAGIVFSADGKRLDWRRDPLDVYAFHLDVPHGVSRLVAEFQYLTPTDGAQGRVVMTPPMLNLQWNAVLLYPAGYTQWQIPFDARVKYPAGFTAATALDVERRDGDTVVYKRVPLEILADSPVYAGRYFKQVDVTPAGTRTTRLNVIADDPKYLEMKPEHVAQHRALVEQAMKLFGSQHYDHYDFLLSLSRQMAGNGLEHQRSSENGQEVGYFKDWDAKTGSDDLLGHEFTHSWNGKYRRPAGQDAPNLNTPLDDRLLWVYEGQTQYWGNVLTTRSGLRPMERGRDALAMVVATYADNRPGLAWRSVLDTTLDPVIAARRPKPYRGYQMSEDYYQAGQLIWLGADALIRDKTGNRKSLDDFARAFFGVNDGEWKRPAFYTLDDVAAALDGVLPMDWKTWLSDRIEGRVPFAKTVEDAGWRLAYKDAPNAEWRDMAKESGGANELYSIGMSVGKDGKVGDVRWDSAAFDAGVGTGMTLVAVNDLEYSTEALTDAIKAAKGGRAPIRLLVKEFDRYRSIAVDYRDGLRYPVLERIGGKPDYLTAILSPRK